MHLLRSIDPNLDVSLESLVELASPLLAGLPVEDQRVQITPDARTVRYYQTAGLLDRPVRYDGRVARYGRRHLLQLVAIRILQSGGLSLAQIQTRLAGATNAELEVIAAGPSAATISEPVILSAYTPSSDTPLSQISAAEVAPGVIITVDARLQPHSARLIEHVRLAIHQLIQQETES
jgi:DNA-binding transcriptional MerR regulator